VHEGVADLTETTGAATAQAQVASPFVECRTRLRAALGRLASSNSSEVIRASAPRELAEACGFTRAMMSAVRGSRWVPLQLYTREELHPESATFRAYIESDAEIPLANLLAETDMVRRRAAVLVDESLIGTRAFKPIVELAQSPAYVAAPIVVEGRAIGFMHADRVGQERLVDDDDRRYVQAFCGELGVVYQRAIWGERIAERARHALNELEQAKKALKLIDSAAVDLPIALDRPPVVAPDADDAVRQDYVFLTAREWEVLDHVADGATNRVIAQRLSVSEDTVKTHMRSVLRKLRVTTRGAAVARYLEISRSLR
jgi:DNA-binding CsgD family transcriptional regulator